MHDGVDEAIRRQSSSTPKTFGGPTEA